MQNIYYVVGSYSHPIGSVDYINALKVFFKETNPQINLLISTKIIKNELNIFLESFDNKYISYMQEFKIKYPKTKYIIICTEFMQFYNRKIVFNCFNKNDFKQEKKLFLIEKYNFINYATFFKSKIILNIKRKIKTILVNKFGLNNKESLEKNIDKNKISNRRKEYHMRAKCLTNIIDYSEFFLGSHPEITNFIKGLQKTAFDFPYFIDEINTKIINKKIKGFYMGGTLNEYREAFVKNKDKAIINIHTGDIYDKHEGFSNKKIYKELLIKNLKKLILEIKIKADLEDLSKELNHQLRSERKLNLNSETNNALSKIKASYYPDSVQSLLDNFILYYQSTSIELPHLLYELYIPQSEEWPYSSPMRFWHTFMNNGIPVTFKRYKDHPLNMVVEIYKNDMNLNLNNYLEKVKSYNLSQDNLYKSINSKINELINDS
tara:strand:- start:20790 stop:22091 length:1302 start_codon:yes stop_codon:yes gene_type:complete